MSFKSMQHIIDALTSLPGITKKHAQKIAYYLLQQDDIYIDTFISRIKNMRHGIKCCKQCNCLTEGNDLCQFCTTKRNENKLCICSNFDQVEKIEATKIHDGLYFVTMEEINTNKKVLELSVNVSNKLCDFFKKYGNITEVLIATDSTSTGELTAIAIKKLLNSINPKISIFRPSIGLPINSTLDYADNISLGHALKNKYKY